jgi:hypothetical protein
MPALIDIIKLASVLLGSAILGNWFLSELKRARMRKLPWYTVYLSPAGLLILAALSLPIIYWIVRR